MAQNGHFLRVLMLPWLAHGHISPFLELAKRLAHRNILVYFCSTPVNLSSIAEKLGGSFPQIKLVEIQLPTLPPQYQTTRSLPTRLNPILMEDFDLSKPAFSDILKTLDPHCLIYDGLMPWAPEAASELNIPAIYFTPIGATCLSDTYLLANPPENGKNSPYPASRLGESETGRIQQALGNKAGGFTFFERLKLSCDRSSSIIAMKTSREIESKFIDILAALTGKELVPVGLLPPQIENQNQKQNQPCKIIGWLEKKQRDSVVFVSFGSEYFMSNEEIEEMGEGLALSGQNFIWVIRFPKDEKENKEPEIEQVLPSGFLKTVGDRGMVVTGWAEQEKILSHPSTGGFITHCGWSSLVEGLRLGVPLIALPMQADQPINASLVVGELGVGVEIERESQAPRFRREKVAKSIRVVMVEEEGEPVRRAAKKMGECLSCKAEEEIDVFVEKLKDICLKQG